MLPSLSSSQVNRAVRTFYYALDDGELESDADTIALGILFGPPKKEK